MVEGTAKKRSATSRWTITHHDVSCSKARLSTTSGVAMLYGRFATSLLGAGESRHVEVERVAPVEVGVRDAGELRLEAAVDFGCVDVCDPVGEVAREHAEPGADLEHHVVGREVGEPLDHAEQVLVDEKVLAQALAWRDAHSENTLVAFSSIWSSRASASTPRASASASRVWRTKAGSLRRPRTGCGAR